MPAPPASELQYPLAAGNFLVRPRAVEAVEVEVASRDEGALLVAVALEVSHDALALRARQVGADRPDGAGRCRRPRADHLERAAVRSRVRRRRQQREHGLAERSRSCRLNLAIGSFFPSLPVLAEACSAPFSLYVGLCMCVSVCVL